MAGAPPEAVLDYTESPDQAAEYADSALTRMKELGIPANPTNFMVWFSYFADRIPDLRRAIDILVDNEQEFTAERNDEIYSRFFTFEQESASLSDAAHKAEEELTRILEHLGMAGDGAAEYGKALKTFSGEITDSPAPDNLRAALTNALNATRAMEHRNHDLEEKFDASSKEISRLREDLESMRHEAMTDGLTGIANRKQFDAELRKAAMEAMEEGAAMCLLILDIDFFKKFNDSYGHQVGDQVLKLLAHTLTSSVKGQDTAARFGGEEFCVILPGTGLDGALKVAEIIRTKIGKKEIKSRTSGENMGQVTVSIGVAQFKFGEPLSQLISRADEALYSAKSSGRNCVVSEVAVASSQLAFDG